MGFHETGLTKTPYFEVCLMLFGCFTYEFQDSEDREIEVWSVLDEWLLGREVGPEWLARCVVELRHAGKS